MFRCSECGSEYKTKPDFCDCGNDIFDEVYETNPVKKSEREPVRLNTLEIFSWIVFVICLLLSVLVLIFFPKIEPVDNNQEKESKTVMEKPNYNIPDLNSFWVDPAPEPEPPVYPVVEQVNDTVNVYIPKQEKPKPQNPVVKQSPKPVVKQQTTQQTTKTQTQQTTKPQTKQTTSKPQSQTTSKPATYTYDVVNYRTALRQRLFSNLDIYKIEGHGTCGIQFSIDESGKLINRNFTFKSDNKSVNEQVYKMLMRTPSFNPPPSSYANKIIKMTFELDNESYVIKFVN